MTVIIRANECEHTKLQCGSCLRVFVNPILERDLRNILSEIKETDYYKQIGKPQVHALDSEALIEIVQEHILHDLRRKLKLEL